MSQETKQVFIVGEPYGIGTLTHALLQKLPKHATVVTGADLSLHAPELSDVLRQIPQKPIEIKPPPLVSVEQPYIIPTKRSKHQNKATHKRKPKGKKNAPQII